LYRHSFIAPETQKAAQGGFLDKVNAEFWAQKNPLKAGSL